MITVSTINGHDHAIWIFGMPLGLYVFGLLLVSVAAVAWRITRNQHEILANTEQILKLLGSQRVFYAHAVDAVTAIDVAVAAGIARGELPQMN